MSRAGFTLIELLIVVAIIGILAAIAVPNFINAQIRARVARVVSEEKSIKNAYSMYFMDQNSWPPHIDGDEAQHRFVTTPIAYLTTSVYCPFMNTHKGRTLTQWQYFKGQYHVEPAYFWHDNQWPGLAQNNPRYWSQQKNTAYFIICIGPDMDYDSPQGCDTCFADIYDTSNGIESSGDIFNSIIGNYKQEFPYSAR